MIVVRVIIVLSVLFWKVNDGFLILCFSSEIEFVMSVLEMGKFF